MYTFSTKQPRFGIFPTSSPGPLVILHPYWDGDEKSFRLRPNMTKGSGDEVGIFQNFNSSRHTNFLP